MLELTNELLIKLLLFILILFVTFHSLMKFLKNKWVSAIIGLIISLTAIFYISYSQIHSLIQVYGITGMVLLISIPFVIVCFFIYSTNITGILRKIFLIFYGVVTILFLQNNNSFSSEIMTSITLIFIFVIIIILFLDKTIKNKFSAQKNLRRR